MDTVHMDPAFRASQAGYEQGYKDGRLDNCASAYDDGWTDGYAAGQADARRGAPTEADLWPGVVDEALDRLVRFFDATDPATANALRDVLKDFQHPSRVWDAPKEASNA